MQLLKPLVLASRSPRRAQLLRQIGLASTIVPCNVAEEFDGSQTAKENALRLALEKAQCVAPDFQRALVVGADTIVVVAGRLLGKPADPNDAISMLRLLSGKTHTVHTAFAVLDRPTDEWVGGVESTTVTFRELPEEEILEYVRTGSPMDKAGAYGIQDDYGAVFVTRLEGCYYTVVGLPLARFYATLRDFQERIEKTYGQQDQGVGR